MSDGQNILNEQQEPTFYARIPKMAIIDLDPYELALYCNYKQTASEHATCYKSNATLAAETGMSVTRLKKARKTLAEKQFISIERHFDEDGVENQPPTVRIVNIWGKNHTRYSDGGRRVATGGSHETTTPQASDDGGVGVWRHQRRTLEEESPKKNPSSTSGDGDGDDRPNVFSLYEDTFGPLTPMLADDLRELEAEYSQTWLADAFKAAALNGARGLAYVKATLKRWQSEGKPSVAQAPQNGAAVTTGDDPYNVPTTQIPKPFEQKGN